MVLMFIIKYPDVKTDKRNILITRIGILRRNPKFKVTKYKFDIVQTE